MIKFSLIVGFSKKWCGLSKVYSRCELGTRPEAYTKVIPGKHQDITLEFDIKSLSYLLYKRLNLRK